MYTVLEGESITFDIKFRDEDGLYYDPDFFECTICRFVNEVLHGPVSYARGNVFKITEGIYRYTYTVPKGTLPFVYTFKTFSYQDGNPRYDYDYFEVLEKQPESSDKLDPPRTFGIMRESLGTSQMGNRLTDELVLIGHADGLNINDPYKIGSLREGVQLLNGDVQSPLFRGMFEAFNAGARDIWLVASAPMREYQLKLEDRSSTYAEYGDKTFYDQYYLRLADTYEVLSEFEEFEIIVPLEAPFYDSAGIDFLGQLSDHCVDAFEKVSQPRIGIIGTRSLTMLDSDIEAMLEDDRLVGFDASNAGGKFVVIAAGEGMFRHPQFNLLYRNSAAASLAGALSTLPINAGLTYQRIEPMISPSIRDFTETEQKALCRARINPVGRTAFGRRNKANEMVLLTDNTLSGTGSDFWSIATTRLVSKVIKSLRKMSSFAIGTIGYPLLRKRIEDYLTSLVQGGVIRDYTFNMRKSTEEYGLALVEVTLYPFNQVREVSFQVRVGADT